MIGFFPAPSSTLSQGLHTFGRLIALCCAMAAGSGIAGATTNPKANPCLTAARMAAAETGVPTSLMLAITLAETGRAQAGSLQPWPWAVHDAGRGYWFATRAEAEAHVRQALAEGRRNIDIGCFQLNHRWHGAAFATVSAMFDPLDGARHAATFLHALHDSQGDWLNAAGAYHSRHPDRATPYRQRIAAIMAALPPSAPARTAGPQGWATGRPLLRGATSPLFQPPPAPLIGG